MVISYIHTYTVLTSTWDGYHYWKLCSFHDLKNASCCCKRWNKFVCPLVWGAVQVEWKSLESRWKQGTSKEHDGYVSPWHFSLKPTGNCINQSNQILKYIFDTCDLKVLSSIEVISRGVRIPATSSIWSIPVRCICLFLNLCLSVSS